MKKRLMSLTALLMSICLAGCGGVTVGGGSTSAAPSTTKAVESSEASSETSEQNTDTSAEAQTETSADGFYKGKTVQMIVPWGAGGGADVAVRLVSKYIEKNLGCTIVVNNVTGGGGSIGLNQMLSSNADGLTLAYVANTDSNGNIMLDGVTYDIDSFAPIAQFAADPHVLAASKASGITDLKGLIEAGKDGTTLWGIGGAWTNWDFLKLEFEKATGTKYKRMAYDGGAAVITDLMNGDCMVGTPLVSEALTAIDAKEIVPIAVSSAKRVESLPDVPTIAEQGYDGFESVMWRGFAAPAGTDVAVLKQFAEGVGKACEDSDFQAEAAKAGVTVSYKNYDDFQKFFKENHENVKQLYEANKDAAK
jgi:tripartite-type tricarboxylate transporter receptor subunit TctC